MKILRGLSITTASSLWFLIVLSMLASSAFLSRSSATTTRTDVGSPGMRSAAEPSHGSPHLVASPSEPDIPIRVTSIVRNGSDIVITFDAVQGATYRLERKLALTEPVWQSVPGVSDLSPSSTGPAQLTDPGAVALGKAYYQVRITVCDPFLPSNSSDPLQYAAAMELCQTTTEEGTDPGVISAILTLPSGTGTPNTQQRAIRPIFGSNNTPLAGMRMVVLSTGAAASFGQTNPSFAEFQLGQDIGTSSPAPADWLAANGGVFPNTPGCPAAVSTTTHNGVMLKVRIRVPRDAHSFRVSAKFFSSEYPEWVCSPYNDFFVVLLDSSYAGTPANPTDKNLATYTPLSGGRYPVSSSLAFNNNTPLFTQCLNGPTGCASGAVSAATNTCVSTTGITNTGMDLVRPPGCGTNNFVGGGTDWLVIRGNVVPGETIELRFALWDTSDGFFDSVVLLDNFSWSQETVTPGTFPQ